MKNLIFGTLLLICHHTYAQIAPAKFVQLGSITDNTIPLVINNMNYPFELHNVDISVENEQQYQDQIYKYFSNYPQVGRLGFHPFHLNTKESDITLKEVKQQIELEQNRIIKEAQSILSTANSKNQTVEVHLGKLQVSENESQYTLSKIEKTHFILSLIFNFNYQTFVTDYENDEIYLTDRKRGIHYEQSLKIRDLVSLHKCFNYLNPKSSAHADYRLQGECLNASDQIFRINWNHDYKFNHDEYKQFKSTMLQRLLKAMIDDPEYFEERKLEIFEETLQYTVKEFDLEQTSNLQKINKRGKKVPSFSISTFKYYFKRNFQNPMLNAVARAKNVNTIINNKLNSILSDYYSAQRVDDSLSVLNDKGELDHKALRLKRLNEINKIFKSRLYKLKALTGKDIIHVISNNENNNENNGARDQIKSTDNLSEQSTSSNAKSLN